ncbi:MAG: CPBP family intramembrane metalloprotease [Oscillospiraceae bacterium]|nr:CPBP family intramembrane metalloprotease [Oscillospiraceae bacterium]
MKKLYEKSEIWFAVIWIVVYVVSLSAADDYSESLGFQKIITAPLCVILTLVIFVWIRKNDLSEKYGLILFKGNPKNYLYFLPLLLIMSVNLWNGVTMNMSAGESALYVLSMLCVGFLEEVIFRGFLFKAMCKTNVKRAIIVSSVTFGIGHIVNLLNGSELLSNLLQVCYAVALGFLFTIIFYKGKSLLPCIVTHSVVNSLSTFGAEGSQTYQMAIAAVLCVISIAYSLWILRAEKNKEQNRFNSGY